MLARRAPWGKARCPGAARGGRVRNGRRASLDARSQGASLLALQRKSMKEVRDSNLLWCRGPILRLLADQEDSEGQHHDDRNIHADVHEILIKLRVRHGRKMG